MKFVLFKKLMQSKDNIKSVDLLAKKGFRFTRGDASWELSLSGVIRCAETESDTSRHPCPIINSLGPSNRPRPIATTVFGHRSQTNLVWRIPRPPGVIWDHLPMTLSPSNRPGLMGITIHDHRSQPKLEWTIFRPLRVTRAINQWPCALITGVGS